MSIRKSSSCTVALLLLVGGMGLAFQDQSAVPPPTSPSQTETSNTQSKPESESAKPPEPGQLYIPTQNIVPPPPPDEDEFRVSSEVELVLLDVAVKDREGGFVTGLTKEHFKVFDNKLEQPIRVFAAQDTPVTVGVVVDNSGSVRPKKPEIVTAALTFVTNSNPKDEMFLISFNDTVMMGLPDDIPFTDDRNLLRQGLLTNFPQGRTSLYDAIKAALVHLEKGQLDKKTLVIISDGGDNASQTTKEEIMSLVEHSLATIYTVGIFDADDKDKNPGFLKSLAQTTGGEAYLPDSVSHLVKVCEKIAKDIRNRYTVGFTPSSSVAAGKPHQVRMLVNDGSARKLYSRTRNHYVRSLPAEKTPGKKGR